MNKLHIILVLSLGKRFGTVNISHYGHLYEFCAVRIMSDSKNWSVTFDGGSTAFV
jgi:hypothetical protein